MNLKSLKYTLVFIVLCVNTSFAQYPYQDKWYQNPLGFRPLNLHTSMAFFVPAIVVGASVLLSQKDPNLKDRLSVYNESGFSWGYKYPNTFNPQNNTGINFMLRKWLSIGADFEVVFPRDKFNHTTGLAIKPFARFYAVNQTGWRLYFESGGGLIYLFDEFPTANDHDTRLGTYLNGITKYGLGSEISIADKAYLLVGIRHLHISNGNTSGVERNPSHDSNGFFIGFSRNL